MHKKQMTLIKSSGLTELDFFSWLYDNNMIMGGNFPKEQKEL